METCAIFQSIKNEVLDPTEVAEEFINAKHSSDDVNLQLTQLLLCSCGIDEKIDENLVKNGLIDDILQFVETKSKDIHDSTTPVRNAKYLKRCVTFFEQIFRLDWNTFVNGGKFDTYFIELLEEFSECVPSIIHVFSFAIRLKLVTAYYRGAIVDDEGKCLDAVKNYAKIMLDKAIFYKSAQCSISACTELYEWIKKDDYFVIDEHLRLLFWSIQLDKPTQVCHALLISYSLLRMEHLRKKLTIFVSRLVKEFENIVIHVKNNNIFDWICRCCELIYEYHKEALSSSLLKTLLDHMFHEKRAKAKSAARFWISSFFDPHCQRKNMRTILNFLKDYDVDQCKALVDSIIDDYTTMVDFKTLVDMILDEDEIVPEEVKLTIEEKEGVLRLMSYSVEEAIKGYPPTSRNPKPNVKGLSLAISHKYACSVTEALLPRFWDIFHLPYVNVERARITLIYIAKFFNFEFMERETIVNFVQECFDIFRSSNQAYCHQVVLDMLMLIMTHVEDDAVKCLCNNTFDMLQSWCEIQLDELIDDFMKDPKKYADAKAKITIDAEAVSIRIVALNRVMRLSRKCAFELPKRMLEFGKSPCNQMFVCILYVCVGLVSEYVLRITRSLIEVCKQEHLKLEQFDDLTRDIEFVVKMLSMNLDVWYEWSDLSVSTFVNLCRVLEAIRNLPLAVEEKWNNLLPTDVRFIIAGYVNHMIKSDADDVGVDVGTRTYVLNVYLKLLENRVLPLLYAYDVMTYMHRDPEVVEKPLREFISHVCATEKESVVVEWLSAWISCVFQLSVAVSLSAAKDFVDLIQPMRKEMQNIILQVIIKGVDFALTGTKLAGNESPGTTAHQFLDVLIILSECLEDKKKRAIEKSFKDKAFKKNDVKTMKNFFKRLKRRPAARKPERSSTVPKPVEVQSPILSSRRVSQVTVEESEAPWSPSSIAQSSTAALGDESDVESFCSSDVSVFAVRTHDDDNAVPGTSSQSNKNVIEVETLSQKYDNVAEFLKSLQMPSVSEISPKDKTAPSRDDDISDESNVAATGNESALPLYELAMLMKDTTLADDFNAASCSSVFSKKTNVPIPPKTSINVAELTVTGQMKPSRVVRLPVSPPQPEKIVSPTKSTSQQSDNETSYVVRSKVAPTEEYVLDSSLSRSVSSGDDDLMKKRLNVSMSDSDSFALQSPTSTPQPKDPPQAETKISTYENVAKLVKHLGGENSSASTSSGDDDGMKKLLNVSISSIDTVVDTTKAPSPLIVSPTLSFEIQPTDTRPETASQAYDNIVKCVNLLAGDDSSASTSSGDDGFLKDVDNVSFSSTDSRAESPKTPIPSPPKLPTDIEPYESLAKYVSRLDRNDSPDSSSSGSDTIKNLSNASDSDPDLPDTRLSEPTSDIMEDTVHPASILTGDDGQQPGTSAAVDVVARNLLRVSLSNPETDTDSSSLGSGTPPTKKRRQFK